jgi:integrase/recombinase XerD
MINLKVSTSIYHDIRRAKKGNKYPVKLCVSYNGKSMYFATNIDLTIDEFKKLNDKRVPKEIADFKNNLQKIETEARSLISKLKPFSFESFKKKFLNKPTDKSVLKAVFSDQIEKLKVEQRVSTAHTYQLTYNSLAFFKPNLSFDDISVDFLKKYEKWMLEHRKSITTVGIYMRTLRAVFNEAIHQELVQKEHYPFGKRKYQIPKGKNIKKALSLEDVEKIYNYQIQTKYEGEAKAKDFWLFSYFANGMNVKEIALLKYKNIQNDLIIYERAKTIFTSRDNPKQIIIAITEDIRKIITKWSTNKPEPENFIFPIINSNDDAERQRALIKQFTRVINDWMIVIAKSVGIQKKVTTYTARHSFSTVLKRSGASTEFISEALGHHDLSTTESYLDSFEDSVKKEYSKALYAFKKKQSTPSNTA